MPPELLFVVSGISQYTGASIAVHLFDELSPGLLPRLVPAMRGLTGETRPWTRRDLRSAAVFGLATAAMNYFFYLAIERLPLGKSVVIEFLGPISVAAVFTRTRRNTAALVLAGAGVAILSGVEIGGDPLGVLFILGAALFWAIYIVLGRRVAALDRGLDGLGVGLLIGSVALIPFGLTDIGEVVTSPRLLVLCALVGVFSSAVGYSIDQIVLRRIPVRRFSLLMALLPVTAMVIGLIALEQVPTVADIVGAVMVISGVLIQDRDTLPPTEV